MLYSVLVDRHNQHPDAVAQRLALLLRVSASQITAQLERGPLSVEVDIPLPTARAVHARLMRQGITARIVDQAGQHVELAPSAHAAAPPLLQGVSAPQASSNLWDDDLEGALNDLDFDAILTKSPQAPQGAPSQAPLNVAPQPVAPVKDPWGSILNPSEPISAQAASAPKPAAYEPEAQVVGWGALGIDAGERPLEHISEVEVIPEAFPPAMPAPMQPDFGAQPLVPLPATPSVTPRAPAFPVSQPKAQPTAASQGFDGQKLASAFAREPDSSKPFAPTGYTEQPPHSVEIAMVLEVLAPGSGHVYNGQPERMWSAATWFFLILPWVKNVRAVRTQAESIKGHKVPMPEDGSLARALKNAAIWYIVMVCTIMVLTMVVGAIVDRIIPPPVAPDLLRSMAADTGIRQAKQFVEGAVAPALGDAQQEFDRLERESMPASERAQRLFLLSLPSCEIRDLHVCKASMQRVVELDSTHPHAFSLMTWASLQSKGGSKQAMPDIGSQPLIDDLDDPLPTPPTPAPAPRETTP